MCNIGNPFDKSQSTATLSKKYTNNIGHSTLYRVVCLYFVYSFLISLLSPKSPQLIALWRVCQTFWPDPHRNTSIFSICGHSQVEGGLFLTCTRIQYTSKKKKKKIQVEQKQMCQSRQKFGTSSSLCLSGGAHAGFYCYAAILKIAGPKQFRLAQMPSGGVKHTTGLSITEAAQRY